MPRQRESRLDGVPSGLQDPQRRDSRLRSTITNPDSTAYQEHAHEREGQSQPSGRASHIAKEGEDPEQRGSDEERNESDLAIFRQPSLVVIAECMQTAEHRVARQVVHLHGRTRLKLASVGKEGLAAKERAGGDTKAIPYLPGVGFLPTACNGLDHACRFSSVLIKVTLDRQAHTLLTVQSPGKEDAAPHPDRTERQDNPHHPEWHNRRFAWCGCDMRVQGLYLPFSWSPFSPQEAGKRASITTRARNRSF